ncbi:MAG: alanine racemase [Caulobacteraceae bacterium]
MPAAETRLTIDLDALAANYRQLGAAAPGAEVAPVVKANGYGLGATPVARRLWAEGARSFFVARMHEGEDLRAELGRERPASIYVLDGCPPGAADGLVAADLTPVLNSLEQVRAWPTRTPAALHVDTGMNRLGVSARDLDALPSTLQVDLVMSHLACAEDAANQLNAAQLERFRHAAERFPGARRSLANSAGVFLGEAFHFDMVRPGICLYGGGSLGGPDLRFRAVATLEAPVLQVREIPAGETVGYGAAFTAAEPITVGLVAAGYADGVLRAASPGGYGWAGGVRCPILGRISMDLIALDISRAGGVGVGTMVELLGPNAPVDDLAASAGSIAYEVLARLTARGRRVYVGDVG